MAEKSKPDLVRLLAQRYNAGSTGYDRYWRPMLAPMSRALLAKLPLARAQAVLDIGCGPGTISRDIRQRNQEALLLGIDNALDMLRRRPHLPGVEWAQMDGQKLALKSTSFDIALMAFVLFHFPDIAAGLREACRILRPDGALGLATFHTSPSFKAKRVWQKAFERVLPSGTATIPDLSAVDQTEKTDRPEKVRAYLEQAGFDRIDTELRSFQHQWQAEDYLALRSSFGSSGARFRRLESNDQEELLKEVRRRFQQLSAEDFQFEPTVLYAIARRR